PAIPPPADGGTSGGSDGSSAGGGGGVADSTDNNTDAASGGAAATGASAAANPAAAAGVPPPGGSQGSAADPRPARNSGRLPWVFEPNRGQADSAAQSLTRGQGYPASLPGPSLLLALRRPDPATPRGADARTQTPAPTTIDVLGVNFLGA